MNDAAIHPTAPAPDKLLLIADVEVATLLSCSRAHVWRLHSSGQIPMPMKLRRLTRWRAQEIADWIAAGCPGRGRWEWQGNARRR